MLWFATIDSAFGDSEVRTFASFADAVDFVLNNDFVGEWGSLPA